MLRAFIASLALLSCSLLAAPKVLVETTSVRLKLSCMKTKRQLLWKTFFAM